MNYNLTPDNSKDLAVRMAAVAPGVTPGDYYATGTDFIAGFPAAVAKIDTGYVAIDATLAALFAANTEWFSIDPSNGVWPNVTDIPPQSFYNQLTKKNLLGGATPEAFREITYYILFVQPMITDGATSWTQGPPVLFAVFHYIR